MIWFVWLKYGEVAFCVSVAWFNSTIQIIFLGFSFSVQCCHTVAGCWLLSLVEIFFIYLKKTCFGLNDFSSIADDGAMHDYNLVAWNAVFLGLLSGMKFNGGFMSGMEMEMEMKIIFMLWFLLSTETCIGIAETLQILSTKPDLGVHWSSCMWSYWKFVIFLWVWMIFSSKTEHE